MKGHERREAAEFCAIVIFILTFDFTARITGKHEVTRVQPGRDRDPLGHGPTQLASNTVSGIVRQRVAGKTGRVYRDREQGP